VFRYPGNSSCPRDLAGRGSFPLCTRASLARELRARRRSWGSPFAGLIPLTGGHAAQARRLNRTFSNISVRPGPRAVRIPLSPCAAGAPRFIFVGPSGRLALVNRKTRKRDGRSGGYLRGVRLLGFDSRLRSGGGQRDRQIHRSCLGLCLLQGCRALVCASPTGSTPPAITSLRRPDASAASSSRRPRALQSAHGFAALPSQQGYANGL
jgi:hypothetical protein